MMEKNAIDYNEWETAVKDLTAYFGLPIRTTMFHVDYALRETPEIEWNNFSREVIPETFIRLQDEYKVLLGDNLNAERIIRALTLLKFILDRAECENEAPDSILEDELQLYLLCRENEQMQGWVSIKTPGGTLRLSNEGNWFFRRLLKNHFCLPGFDEEAELQYRRQVLESRRRKGRRPKSEKVRAAIWGGYKMLRDLHGFKADMPNTLCEFLIRMLRALELIPADSEIDIYWIRAELRYIRSRSVKPSFTGTYSRMC